MTSAYEVAATQGRRLNHAGPCTTSGRNLRAEISRRYARPPNLPTAGQTCPAPTDAEAMRLRAALRNMRGLFGTWGCLAEAMGVPTKSLTSFVSGTRNGSPGLALAAARAAGKTVDELLGEPRIAGTCPHCGARWEVNT